jgi:hypothetical protein
MVQTLGVNVHDVFTDDEWRGVPSELLRLCAGQHAFLGEEVVLADSVWVRYPTLLSSGGESAHVGV